MLNDSSLALHLPASLTDTFRVLDLCGVLLNGILGGLIARRKNFDLVGFVVLAMLTATAGGILRDVMIQAGPPFARRLLVVADAVILGCWAATGASKALTHGLGVMPALLLGCLTAIGGSMIRDVAVGETPAVFGGNKLYAIPALIAAGTQVLAVRMGMADAHAMLASTAVGAGLCLLAYWRSWRLPVIADRERRRAGRRSGSGALVGWRRALMMAPLKTPVWRGRGRRVADAGRNPAGTASRAEPGSAHDARNTEDFRGCGHGEGNASP